MLSPSISYTNKQNVIITFSSEYVSQTKSTVSHREKVPNVALRLQHRRRDDGRARFTTVVVWRQVTGDSVETWISRQGSVWEDLNAATESPMPTSWKCSTVTIGLFCLVSEIWPRDGQRTAEDGMTTTTIAYRALKAGQQ